MCTCPWGNAAALKLLVRAMNSPGDDYRRYRFASSRPRTPPTFGVIKSTCASAITTVVIPINKSQTTGRAKVFTSFWQSQEANVVQDFFFPALGPAIYILGFLSQVNIWKAHRLSFVSDGKWAALNARHCQNTMGPNFCGFLLSRWHRAPWCRIQMQTQFQPGHALSK